ncbi:hypothetical protein QFZ39_005095 [Paraburkholderia graminis]|nr:hypothetical protein [Paraburkholderia graminis]
MRRLLAIGVFLTGGLAAELAHPLQCSLIRANGNQLKRRSR